MPTNLPSRAQNPNGLHHRYNIEKADGSPLAPGAEYFVLRVDPDADPKHREASLRALSSYADAIEKTQPQLAADIRQRHGLRPSKTLFAGYGTAAEVADGLQDTAKALRASEVAKDRTFIWALRSA